MVHQSAYDTWSPRCPDVIYFQWFLSIAFLAALVIGDVDVYQAARPRAKHIAQTSEKIAAIFPALLPLMGRLSWPYSGLKSFGIRRRECTDPLAFAVSQILQLIACIAITVHNGIRYWNGPLFWISLILYCLPAVFGFGYAMNGLKICYFRKAPFAQQASDNDFEQYTDSIEENEGPLLRAYRVQNEDDEVQDGSSPLELSHSTKIESRTASVLSDVS